MLQSLQITPVSEWPSVVPTDVFKKFQSAILKDRKDFLITIYFLAHAFASLKEMVSLLQKLHMHYKKCEPFDLLQVICYLFKDNPHILSLSENNLCKLTKSISCFFAVIYQKKYSLQDISDIISIFEIQVRYNDIKKIESYFKNESCFILTDDLHSELIGEIAWRKAKYGDISEEDIFELMIYKDIPSFYSEPIFLMIIKAWNLLGDIVYAWLWNIAQTDSFTKMIIPTIAALEEKYPHKGHQVIIDELSKILLIANDSDVFGLVNIKKMRDPEKCSYISLFLYKIWWYHKPYKDKIYISVYHRAIEYVAFELFGKENIFSFSPKTLLQMLKTEFENNFPALGFDDAKGESLIFEYLRARKKQFS